jgi:putative ABC transport system permease protein
MLIQDIRYAIRSLVKNRGVTSVAVLCMALGIGVNATIFSVIDGVMIKPYPFPDAERIVVPSATNQRMGIGRTGYSYQDFKDLRDQNTSFESVAAFTGRSLTISDSTGEPERYSGSTVSWNLFELLGTPPVLGRAFNKDDDRPGAEPVVMLSDEVWQRRYNGDRSIVGRAININAKPHTVIGVMPPGFRFPENQRLWVTVAPYSEKLARDWRGHQVFGRMRPGVTIDRATTDAKAIAARLEAAYPTTNRDWSAIIRPLQQWMLPEQVKLMLTTMMSAVTLVLLVACANVANLLLARATTRHREIALRAALGAGRWRIVRQLLTESVAIGLLSAPAGFLIAWIGIKLLDSAMPADGVPWFIKWALDGRSLAYTIGVSMLTGIVFGLVPALQSTGSSLQDSLKEGGRGTAGGRRAWLRNTLVVAEVALSLVLLIGAALFVRSFLNQQNADNGFDTAPLMTMRFYMPGDAYEDNDAKARRVEDIVRRIESVPGVQAAFASNFIPFSGGGGGGNAIVEGKAVEKGQ